MEEEEIIASPQSLTSAYVRLVNTTGRTVCVWWYDFNGGSVPYGNIPHGGFKDLNTFEDHVWGFTDIHTGERYKVNGEYLFKAKPKYMRRSGRVFETRSKWNIQRDVRPLLSETIRLVAKLIGRSETARLLGLPKHLADLVAEIAREHERCIERVELCDFY